ncbi:MAG: type IV pilus assembly protein PilM [bacterium]
MLKNPLGKIATGIELTIDSVKLCRLKKKDKIFLLNLCKRKIHSEPLRDDEKDAWSNLAIDAIKKLLSENKIKAHEVYVSIPSSSVVIRYLKLPYMPPEELREVIRFEAEEHIPFEVEQALMDFHITKDFIEKEERIMEVLLVAAKREVIHEYIHIFQKVGLDPIYINVDTFGIEDAWEIGEEGSTKGEKVVALVDIGGRTTNINIIEGNASSFNRDIIVGGNDFTDSVKDEFGITFSEAENKKEEKGAILLGEEYGTVTDDEKGRISYCLESVASRLLDELDRSFTYYYTQLPSYKKNIDKIILSGGSANLPNLPAFLSQGLGINVVLTNPFLNIDLSKGNFKPGEIERKKTGFTASIGLALRGLQ